MNGLTGTRRLARPVRLVLAGTLGADIDGAWWPHTGSTAGELPQLIGVLHRRLGEIVDICVNWSATEGALDLNSILTSARPRAAAEHRRHRLMMVVGRTAQAKLLVVPHMTTPALGNTVMRCASGRPLVGSERDGQWCDAAESVLRDAKAESALWTSRLSSSVT
ncbi:DUF5994 family protein [Mycolicibacterium holsaticum]|uniref:DUF5994 family protein n=1 Tax=Mycolicibacterium holsaticum TaxID=152142 RepID=UPI001C7DE3EE|nr:DUF5994 family protein [Mycolicibacterium holsaticum]MDA4110210.1 hypothetical protein [Mycolicibacterium holsaticum DSM 44478 = JCM 12374]QZA15480.1 hypothetical protein K3U96_22440 [Mycolicibacterium holsaticum DSM 44478 = JCM 12374]UNC12249.1 hypothetical protein H5U41_04375 [Mycolicibacterium holsaticum DSM 44478 = JCM 12374]